MTSEEVIEIYTLLNRNEISVWVDGGWGVDALLGRQTREHEDLDIAVERKDNEKLLTVLGAKGFAEKARPDSTGWMYVLQDDSDKIVDVHVFEYDENGKNTYGIEYPFGSLNGSGKIGECKVNCIAPEWMFKFKTTYKPKEKDIQDVRALSEKFGYDLPQGYTIN